jgi:uncharacterized SAM-dependent methyltransferase
MSLLQQEIDLIYQRIDGYDHFNIFDLGVTNGISTLPFVLELLQEDRLKGYIPVTGNISMNEHAINNLRAFTLMSMLPGFETSHIVKEPETTSFREDILAVEGDRSTTANLFLLMNSGLGNYINPSATLKNIYDSMGNGDHLAVIQGVYKSGSEDLLVADYLNIFDYMRDTKGIALMLNPDAQFNVFWDDQIDQKGIKIDFNIDEPVEFGQTSFETGDNITILRSRRFTSYELEEMFKSVGFRVVTISYDNTANSALFLVAK